MNASQKEGLARYVETLSAASIIGAIAGAFAQSPLALWQIGTLVYIAVWLLNGGHDLRGEINGPV